MAETAIVNEDKNVSKEKAEVRWYEGHSVQQFAERLEEHLKRSDKNEDEGSLLGNIDDSHKEAVAETFKAASIREDQSTHLSLALAMMYGAANDEQKKWIYDITVMLGKGALVWETVEKCAEITIGIPGKQAKNWLDVIYVAQGEEFLANLIFKLPYRLWTIADKVLHENNGKDVLKKAVCAELAANRTTADLLFWLWKCKDEDMDATREKYLSDAALIFRTLHQDMSGDYLKAQRDLRHLLLSDGEFQNLVCKDGDHAAVLELIRCTKRLSLLAPDERQSLLIKIFNLYPQFKSDIEEKRKGPARVSVGRITSRHGYNRRVAELEHLVNVDIPENTKAIETARAHGDLRENSEFKFAKERQRFLGQRRREWEESLVGLQVTDFAETRIERVIIPGCTVVLKHEDGRVENIHLLGMLDSETEKDIISYDTPLGKLLLGNEAGAEIKLPSGSKAEIVEVKPLSKEILAYIAK